MFICFCPSYFLFEIFNGMLSLVYSLLTGIEPGWPRWILSLNRQQRRLSWAVAVAQLVDRSLPIPEVSGSNQVIGKKSCIEHLFTVNCIEKTKIKKKKKEDGSIKRQDAKSCSCKKWANSGLFFVYFRLFKQALQFYNKYMWKKSVQYAKLGFETTTTPLLLISCDLTSETDAFGTKVFAPKCDLFTTCGRTNMSDDRSLTTFLKTQSSALHTKASPTPIPSWPKPYPSALGSIHPSIGVPSFFDKSNNWLKLCQSVVATIQTILPNCKSTDQPNFMERLNSNYWVVFTLNV